MSQPESPPALVLNHGLTFTELFTPEGLQRIDSLFLSRLRERDAKVHDTLLAWRSGQENLTPLQLSELLLACGPVLNDFIANLFNIREALEGGTARPEMERRYAPARATGNPITVRPQGGAVQVLAAEGFGNTGPASTQQGTGFGRWRESRWATVIARPIDAGPDLAPLRPGVRTYLAVAVWDGAAGHTGSRKMRSGWIPLVLEAP